MALIISDCAPFRWCLNDEFRAEEEFDDFATFATYQTAGDAVPIGEAEWRVMNDPWAGTAVAELTGVDWRLIVTELTASEAAEARVEESAAAVATAEANRLASQARMAECARFAKAQEAKLVEQARLAEEQAAAKANAQPEAAAAAKAAADAAQAAAAAAAAAAADESPGGPADERSKAKHAGELPAVAKLEEEEVAARGQGGGEKMPEALWAGGRQLTEEAGPASCPPGRPKQGRGVLEAPFLLPAGFLAHLLAYQLAIVVGAVLALPARCGGGGGGGYGADAGRAELRALQSRYGLVRWARLLQVGEGARGGGSAAGGPPPSPPSSSPTGSRARPSRAGHDVLRALGGQIAARQRGLEERLQAADWSARLRRLAVGPRGVPHPLYAQSAAVASVLALVRGGAVSGGHGVSAVVVLRLGGGWDIGLGLWLLVCARPSWLLHCWLVGRWSAVLKLAAGSALAAALFGLVSRLVDAHL